MSGRTDPLCVDTAAFLAEVNPIREAWEARHVRDPADSFGHSYWNTGGHGPFLTMLSEHSGINPRRLHGIFRGEYAQIPLQQADEILPVAAGRRDPGRIGQARHPHRIDGLRKASSERGQRSRPVRPDPARCVIIRVQDGTGAGTKRPLVERRWTHQCWPTATAFRALTTYSCPDCGTRRPLPEPTAKRYTITR